MKFSSSASSSIRKSLSRKNSKKNVLDRTLHEDEELEQQVASSSSSQGINPQCPPISMKPTKSKYEIAIFACGEFWVPQRRFAKMGSGIKRVIAGYTGGDDNDISNSFVSFQDTKDHTMALMIEYNPKKISYKQLLEMWHDNDYPWEDKDDELDDVATQSAIYPTSIQQEQQAKEYIKQLEIARGGGATAYVTMDSHITKFYQAELYQQNYISKQIIAAKEQFLLWANDEAHTSLYTIYE